MAPAGPRRIRFEIASTTHARRAALHAGTGMARRDKLERRRTLHDVVPIQQNAPPTLSMTCEWERDALLARM